MINFDVKQEIYPGQQVCMVLSSGQRLFFEVVEVDSVAGAPRLALKPLGDDEAEALELYHQEPCS